LPTTYDPTLHYNCFIEAAVRTELRQECYCELRRRGKIWASHYLPDGRLQLIVSDLKAGIDACNAAIDSSIRDSDHQADFVARLKRDRDNLSGASREGVTVFVYHEPEPLETIRADRFVRVVNETITDLKSDQSPMTIFRTDASQFQRRATGLSPETMLLYRSRVHDFWHFIFVHKVDEGFIYGGQENRKVLLSYCVDEFGQVLLVATVDIRKILFPSEHELSEHELGDILVAYRYKPYSETAEALYKTFESCTD
jgi:hypothetical protein